jgi:putative addiction module component (TIGR02574 family)
MTSDADALFRAALALPEREREWLAERLWLSVDETTREEAAEAWAREIGRRLNELKQGGPPEP